MIGLGAQETLESMIATLTLSGRSSQIEADALRLLLADFLACVQGAAPGPENPDRAAFQQTGGPVADLALRGSLLDLDDVHWRTLVHPGSVIWPVVLGVGSQIGADGPSLLIAARAGYRATIAMARLLGPGHAARFHATSTSGAFGAAMAAGTLVGLTQGELVAAGAHAISAAGGLGQATIERSRSTVFHRVAAATMGCQAARFAEMGYGGSVHVLDGEKGALAVLGDGNHGVPIGRATDASEVSEVSVRIYPVNGFAQGPVEMAARLGNRMGHDADSLHLEVPSVVARSGTSEYGGLWWDLKSATAAAFASGDPFDLRQTQLAVKLRDRVNVTSSDLPLGACRLAIQSGERVAEELVRPPGSDLSTEDTRALLVAKWRHILGPADFEAESVVAKADGILRNGCEGID